MTAAPNADPSLVAVVDHLLTVGRQKLWSMADELLAVLAAKGQTAPDPLDGVVAVILRFTTGPQGTQLMVCEPQDLAGLLAMFDDPGLREATSKIVARPSNGLLRVLVYDLHEAGVVASLRTNRVATDKTILPG